MNRANKTDTRPKTGDADRCPLCGAPNNCRLCTSEAYKGSCWCETVEIPDALLARVPEAKRNRACICRSCVEASLRTDGELS